MAIHLNLLLVLALCTVSAFGDLLWSIDCGTPATSIYTDTSLITWIGDSEFFQDGTSTHMVESTSSISKVYDTLRVFTARKKNCYDLKVGAGTKVLLRASFVYGNYDLRESPPTFDIHFDGNYWATVDLNNGGGVYYELLYVVKRDYLSVCLAQTNPNQFPFISALEVRSFESLMYSKVAANVALLLQNRVAYGSTSTIRFSNDPYDRIWRPARVGLGQIKVTNEAFLVLDTDTDNHPPLAMLQNAITTLRVSSPLILDTGLSVSSDIYLNLYLTEVTKLGTSQKRSFQFCVNNRPISDPILPSYQYAKELYLSNYTISSGATFSLVATADSDLPPLISGMEVFIIRDDLTQGTDINDYECLVSVQKAFSTVLNDWGGDPCLPSSYSWEWVTCSDDAIPRIKAINLNGYGLEGIIPDFSSMDALETINLQNNSLVGPIPDSLGSLPNLKRLNVADNKLSGSIPTSLSKNNKLDLVWTGNPSLCKSGCQTSETPGYVPANTPGYVTTTRRSKKSKTPIIVGITIPAFLVFWAVLGLVVVLRKRKAAALAAGIAGGVNRSYEQPQGGSGNHMNSQMAGHTVEAVMNELTANTDASSRQTNNQPQPQV